MSTWLDPESSRLDATRRAADLEHLSDGAEVDVLVVGGGVTGAGVALDAAARGLSVALIERRDLATGTSRWSSKLVHGGLRYLAHGEFGLALESARERATLMQRTAPHLTRPMPILAVLGDDVERRDAALYGLGIRTGDCLRSLARTRRGLLPRARRVDAEAARAWAPALRADGLRGAVLHWDGRLEDDARLVVGLARTAASHGARILTYVEALELHDGGARAHDVRTGTTLDIHARHVVNATGVWAGELAPRTELRPSRGSHLLVAAERLGNPRAGMFVPVPGAFGRFVFAHPRPDGLVLIGLTDVSHGGEMPDAPHVTAAEQDMLLDTLGRALERPLTAADVVGRFAGLRPLLAGDGETADLSRRHAVLEDPDSGVLTVVGGKLTTYRRMAEEVVDRIARRRGVAAGPCRTARLGLVGAGPLPAGDVPARLLRRFGAEAGAVRDLAWEDPRLLEPVAPGVPVLGVELRFAVEHELALTVEDVVERRTRAGLVPAWREATRSAAAELLPELLPAVAA